MHLIRIAICDDDVMSLDLLHHLTSEHIAKHPRIGETEILRFQSPYDLLDCMENPNRRFDIYLLDIVMPDYTGIELARMIRKNDEYAMIIYATASAEFALDAAGTSPLQYLVKPIEPDKLYDALDAALRRIDQMQQRNVLIKCKGCVMNIGLHQIEYVEYREHALVFHLNDGREVSSRIIQESFSSIAENTLHDPRFLKPHASYVVNMDYVAGVNASSFEMLSGASVPISKRIYSSAKQQFVDYVKGKTDTIII